MTPDDKRYISLLSLVTFRPATADKRFAKDITRQLAGEPDKPLSEKQAAYLRQIVHRYRRQHGQCDCEECKK